MDPKLAHRITAGIFLLAAVALMGWLALRYLAPPRPPDESPAEVNLPVTAKEPAEVNTPAGTTPDGTGAEETAQDADTAPLRMVVMDPLCAQLACDCVEGYAQRRYDRLAAFLEKRLGRPVRLTYGENLAETIGLNPDGVDLIVGKKSIVVFDAARAGTKVRALAGLTDKNGAATVAGLFVVRRDDPARTIEDLEGRRILFGPADEIEKSTAAIAALQSKGVPLPKQILTSPACSTAAIAVVENEADAAVISSYAVPLLEGCGNVEKGALRVVGRTADVPFVTVFATEKVTSEDEQAVLKTLLAVESDMQLLVDMESKAGFVGISGQSAEAALSYPPASVVQWTDWRGPNRDGISQYVPGTVPVEPKFLWRRPLTGIAASGLAATAGRVIVADKDKDEKSDIFLCLDAATGNELWAVTYRAEGDMEFGNAPRANPVIHDGMVYLLGAFGDLHCIGLESGRVVWKKNIVEQFGAELPTWGMCTTPLVVDDKLIVNPGAKEASLAALDLGSGQVVWQTPGEPAAYSSFITGVFGNVRQIVGYDSVSLGGWDPNTGRRLWKLVPQREGDFNVATPINAAGRLLVATENNGARLYDFDDSGAIIPEPAATSEDLLPDSSTPVLVNDLLFGCSLGLFCLDVGDGLKTLYSSDDDAFGDYCALAAGNGNVLIMTVEGEMIIIQANPNSYNEISRLRLFEKTEVWSHPALVGDRMYIRNTTEICCLLLNN